MKYIRTKDMIYKCFSYNELSKTKQKELNQNTIGEHNKYELCNKEFVLFKYPFCIFNNLQPLNLFKVIKQSDTIEELIDEYVLVEKSARCFLNYDEITEDDLKLCLQDHDIFGAIWTDKGLIYVAKMNDKGELELL